MRSSENTGTPSITALLTVRRDAEHTRKHTHADMILQVLTMRARTHTCVLKKKRKATDSRPPFSSWVCVVGAELAVIGFISRSAKRLTERPYPWAVRSESHRLFVLCGMNPVKSVKTSMYRMFRILAARSNRKRRPTERALACARRRHMIAGESQTCAVSTRSRACSLGTTRGYSEQYSSSLAVILLYGLPILRT